MRQKLFFFKLFLSASFQFHCFLQFRIRLNSKGSNSVMVHLKYFRNLLSGQCLWINNVGEYKQKKWTKWSCVERRKIERQRLERMNKKWQRKLFLDLRMTEKHSVKLSYTENIFFSYRFQTCLQIDSSAARKKLAFFLYSSLKKLMKEALGNIFFFSENKCADDISGFIIRFR